MKYEDIYNGEGGFNRGKLRDYLEFLMDECNDMAGTFNESESDNIIDSWNFSDCYNHLRHIWDLTLAESVFGYDLSDITDPQSKFIADKALRTFGRKVICSAIRRIKDDIRRIEFEDYRAKNLHMEIYRAMQLLYEDYCKEYDVKE